jgi:hydroxypyruvate reductase
MAAPATVISLILSDVVGDTIEYIASGPTAATTTDAADALAVLEAYRITASIPAPVIAHLEQAQANPRSSAEAQSNLIIGSNRVAALAAQEAAGRLGFEANLMTSFLQGEAREVGQVVAAFARVYRFGG